MGIGERIRDLFETMLLYLIIPIFLILALIAGEDEDPLNIEDPLVYD